MTQYEKVIKILELRLEQWDHDLDQDVAVGKTAEENNRLYHEHLKTKSSILMMRAETVCCLSLVKWLVNQEIQDEEYKRQEQSDHSRDCEKQD